MALAPVGERHFDKRLVWSSEADFQVVPVIAIELKFTNRIRDGLAHDRTLPHQKNYDAPRRPVNPSMHHLTRESARASRPLFELQVDQVASGLIYQVPLRGSAPSNGYR